jgi:hypothetical protein
VLNRPILGSQGQRELSILLELRLSREEEGSLQGTIRRKILLSEEPPKQ